MNHFGFAFDIALLMAVIALIDFAIKYDRSRR